MGLRILVFPVTCRWLPLGATLRKRSSAEASMVRSPDTFIEAVSRSTSSWVWVSTTFFPMVPVPWITTGSVANRLLCLRCTASASLEPSPVTSTATLASAIVTVAPFAATRVPVPSTLVTVAAVVPNTALDVPSRTSFALGVMVRALLNRALELPTNFVVPLVTNGIEKSTTEPSLTCTVPSFSSFDAASPVTARDMAICMTPLFAFFSVAPTAFTGLWNVDVPWFSSVMPAVSRVPPFGTAIVVVEPGASVIFAAAPLPTMRLVCTEDVPDSVVSATRTTTPGSRTASVTAVASSVTGSSVGVGVRVVVCGASALTPQFAAKWALFVVAAEVVYRR
mmetsp:Transcript_34481/g.57531  ORF Transcript_34481/g.57531 Transcript_34481/m.57531 type:complete len:337 (+) Transcript_34481:942-1952(+)